MMEPTKENVAKMVVILLTFTLALTGLILGTVRPKEQVIVEQPDTPFCKMYHLSTSSVLTLCAYKITIRKEDEKVSISPTELTRFRSNACKNVNFYSEENITIMKGGTLNLDPFEVRDLCYL